MRTGWSGGIHESRVGAKSVICSRSIGAFDQYAMGDLLVIAQTDNSQKN
jgi:hypothetical protein